MTRATPRGPRNPRPRPRLRPRRENGDGIRAGRREEEAMTAMLYDYLFRA